MFVEDDSELAFGEIANETARPGQLNFSKIKLDFRNTQDLRQDLENCQQDLNQTREEAKSEATAAQRKPGSQPENQCIRK